MKYTFFILAVMLSLFSCQTSVDGNQGDTIKLSTDKLFSSAEGGVFEVTTEGKTWLIENYSISVDSKFYNMMCCDSIGWYWLYDNIEYPIEAINTNRYYNYIVKIEGPWFSVHRENEQKIIFYVLPNNTGKDRTLILYLNDMDFFTGITLTQSAN